MSAAQRWTLAVFVVVAIGTGVVALAAGAWLAHRALRTSAWHTHADPMGFTVELPSSWTLDADRDSGRVTFAGPAGEHAIVWPLYSPAALSPKTAGDLLHRIAPRLWPDAEWSAVDKSVPRLPHATGKSGSRRGVCALSWVGSARGSSAFVYFLSAPAGLERATEETFARVLGSFRLSASPTQAPRTSTPGRAFVRWVDPVEHAFSAEVPSGWHAEGGTRRPALQLVQAQLEAASVDGEERIALGDAFPVYVEPNPILSMAGIEPGGIYLDPMGHGSPVAAYLPGVSYALRAVLPRRAGSFRVLRQAARPDAAARLARIGMNRYDAGEAEYVFSHDGRERRGFVVCVTERIAAPAVTVWHVWRLLLAEATPTRYDAAVATLERAAVTFEIDSTWARRQAQLTAEQSRIIGEMGRAVSQTINDTHTATQSTLDDIHRRGADARREVEDLVDSRTGREITVASGSSYYWVDDRGVILGTNTDTNPGVDFRKLARVL